MGTADNVIPFRPRDKYQKPGMTPQGTPIPIDPCVDISDAMVSVSIEKQKPKTQTPIRVGRFIAWTALFLLGGPIMIPLAILHILREK